MDVGITARHKQSKGHKNGVEKKSNTPICNWAEILVTEELKSNSVQDGQTPAWLDLVTYARAVSAHKILTDRAALDHSHSTSTRTDLDCFIPCLATS